MKTLYTVGFLFNRDKSKVVLLRKLRPTWQANRLNGIGGKIEKGETPLQCMTREFHEEVEYPKMHDWEWLHYATIESPNNFVVACFTACGDIDNIRSKTDELVEIIEVEKINPLRRKDMIENLPWLISMAIDALDDGRPEFALVMYPAE